MDGDRLVEYRECSTNDEHLVPQATQCHTTGDHENEPEDTEYSSDDDLAFWQKMKKRSKQRLKKSYRKKLFHKYFPDQSSSKNSPVNSQKDQNSLSTKEGNKTSNKVSSVVKGSEDDWITDDEEDDEDDENIDLAFKREWEEKRLPPNTKEKNFVCSICGKAYSKSSFLRTHIVRKHKEHEEAKRYPHFCQHCRKVYLREKDLMKHKQQFRGPCEICGVVLGCSDLFWVHRRDHDSICKYACGFCNITLVSNEDISQHMHKYHDMDIDSPREIRLQIERVRLSEIDKNAKGVRIVGSEETYPQELDKPTHFGSSSDKLSLLVPPSAMPLNVNVVEVVKGVFMILVTC
ncbi:Myoneurin [Portunus trituberculatus]|uniref:Myoneurin n=1 Tax=Portunus trituberculatus TaxID=210409 RepID=A0A5B7EGR3_PORTR|nr:Myoneurin [Portunus trituberculatus]